MHALYRKVKFDGIEGTFGTGWLPPLPDLRDHTAKHSTLAQIATKLGLPLSLGDKPSLPDKADLREWCSPVENQGSLGSCTAHAAVGIVEYYERRAFGKHLEASRLFVYKATRNLLGVTGDTGAWLRSTMGALKLFGWPPEQYWPYTDAQPYFDNEPPAFVYALADNYKTLEYFRHDPADLSETPTDVLLSVKRHLAAGVPSMFGFFGFPSFRQSNVLGALPYPCPGEQAIWGHGVSAVGYDDSLEITNTQCGQTTRGALLLRNSWSVLWGQGGYGWLPYDYVLNRLATDFWSIVSMEWVETGQFGI